MKLSLPHTGKGLLQRWRYNGVDRDFMLDGSTYLNVFVQGSLTANEIQKGDLKGAVDPGFLLMYGNAHPHDSAD
ncbi:hypothetical protein TNCV_1216751 [Trichonephila clavipes]|nr:hypothetical protein TNCV_1216751 [Trichonephila clavipes]